MKRIDGTVVRISVVRNVCISGPAMKKPSRKRWLLPNILVSSRLEGLAALPVRCIEEVSCARNRSPHVAQTCDRMADKQPPAAVDDPENEEVDFELGTFVLGYDAKSREWKTCELIDFTDAGYKVSFWQIMKSCFTLPSFSSSLDVDISKGVFSFFMRIFLPLFPFFLFLSRSTSKTIRPMPSWSSRSKRFSRWSPSASKCASCSLLPTV